MGGAGGAGGQAGSGGGGSTRTTGRTTTTTPTSTTTGVTTTTTTDGGPLQIAAPPEVLATPSCTPSKLGGYDFKVRFLVRIKFTGSGIFHFYWDHSSTVEGAGGGSACEATTVGPHDVSGNRPSRTDTVTDYLHILDPPSVKSTVTLKSAICP